MILYGVILLLLCKVSLIFSQAKDSLRRIPDCIPTCYHHNSYVLPFFSKMSSEDDVLKFKYMLLNEIEQCSNEERRFALSIYLPPSQSWIRCCGVEHCFKTVMQIHLKTLKTNFTLTEYVDEMDQAQVYDVSLDTMEEASYLPASTVRLYMDYLVTDFENKTYYFSQNFSLTTVSIPAISEAKLRTLYPNITTSSLNGYSDLIENPQDGICSQENISSSCPLTNSTRQPDDETTVNFRIFLGFGSLNGEHFKMILRGIYNLLSEPLMSQNTGKIIISGPKGILLGACFWYDMTSCVLQLSSHNKEDIFVPTNAVSQDDLEFSPDILNYMRNEALKKSSSTTTFVLVVTDFISMEFLKNDFFFKRAMKKQQIGLSIALVLNWNGLDKNTVDKYYANVTSDVITLHVLDDLQSIKQRIVSVSRRNSTQTPNGTTPAVTTTTTTQTSFGEPSEELTASTTFTTLTSLTTTGKSIPEKTTIPTTSTTSTTMKISTVGTSESFSTTERTTSTSSTTPPSNKPDNNIIIALSLEPSITETDLANLKTYLTQTAAECANEDRQVAIQLNNLNMTMLCSTPACVQSQISSISINQIRTFTDDNTVDELQAVLSLLNPDVGEVLPSLFLLTDFISKDLITNYEDMINFRQKLGSVDFQVILIDKIQNVNISSSFPKKNLHTLATYTDLLKSNNLFCSIEYHFHLSDVEIAGIVVGSALTILIIIYVIYKFWDYVSHLQWQNKFLRLEQTSKKENDYLGRRRKSGTILTIQNIICSMDDPWEMSRHQISLGTEIGRGSCGTVYRGSLLGRAPCEYIHKGSFFAYQFENNTVAVKVQSTATDDRYRKQLLNEIEIMKALNPHPNIANILGYVASYNPICVVMEYADGGSLKEFMMGRKIELFLSPSDVEAKVTCRKDVLSFLWQICDGMSYISDCGVVHRDLAARNILLQGKRNVLISDFGLAIWKEENKKNNLSKRLPIKWTAPEALAHEHFSESSDVWSFGVCAWEILSSGDDPYSHIPNTEFLSYIKSGKRLEMPVACDDQLWSLLLDCWSADAARRPTFTALKNSLTAQLDELCQHYGYLDLSKVAS